MKAKGFRHVFQGTFRFGRFPSCVTIMCCCYEAPCASCQSDYDGCSQYLFGEEWSAEAFSETRDSYFRS